MEKDGRGKVKAGFSGYGGEGDVQSNMAVSFSIYSYGGYA